jgi:tRNA threonylcarbamoyladenosine biosynthesis protein TsaE
LRPRDTSISSFIFTAANEQDTERLGRALADSLPEGTVVALCGPLGAGKTRLVQAFAEARGVAREFVTSPTFVLLQHYGQERPIHHFDVYRLADEDEFLQLGADEYFESNGITFIEWADRVAAALPDERIEIHITIEPHDARRFKLTGVGAKLSAVTRQIERSLT